MNKFVRGQPSPIWLIDDSPIPMTAEEQIESLEDELKRTRSACEYWRLIAERKEPQSKG